MADFIGDIVSVAAPAALGFVVGGPVGAAIGAGVGLASAAAGSSQQQAIEQASQSQAAASAYATDLQRRMYEENVARQQPWLEAGENALARLAVGTQEGGEMIRPFSTADYQADPGYAFRLSEGIKAIDRSAAARGQLLSGGQLKGVLRYGQDLASQEYQNAFNRYQQQQGNVYNRLASLAGVGQTATGALAQAGQQYGTSAGNIATQSGAEQANALLAAGQARASGYQGISGTLGALAGSFGGFGSPTPTTAYPGTYSTSMWT